jgi:hypothetical protein
MFGSENIFFAPLKIMTNQNLRIFGRGSQGMVWSAGHEMVRIFCAYLRS